MLDQNHAPSDQKKMKGREGLEFEDLFKISEAFSDDLLAIQDGAANQATAAASSAEESDTQVPASLQDCWASCVITL